VQNTGKQNYSGLVAS